MLNKLFDRFPVVSDGAWGTALQNSGLPQGACPDEWNLSQPEKVGEVASSYVQAGSQIILSNTFGSNPLMLERHHLEDKAHQINKAGAAISKRAAGDQCKVFASMGPCGKMLAVGEVTPQEVENSFHLQAEALAEGGADGIVVETMIDIEEARLALKGALATKLPVVVSMVYDAGPEKDRTMMGNTIAQSAHILYNEGASATGSNCGSGISTMKDICRQLAAASPLPVWIKGNAGLPEMVNGEIHYHMTPDAFATHALDVIDCGASFVGGCCGTRPDFIRATTQLLEQ